MFAQADPDAGRGAGPARRPDVRLDGRPAFTDALRTLLLGLPGQAAAGLRMVDRDYLGWPLDEPAVLDSLTAWLRRPGRRWCMIGHDFEAVARHHPRFASWRRDYVHCLSACRPEPPYDMELGGLLLAGGQVVELLDREHWQARLISEPASVRAAEERIEALLLRCEPAWPVVPVGL